MPKAKRYCYAPFGVRQDDKRKIVAPIKGECIGNRRMILDSRQIDQFATITADICVIGAGAAGITMALQFVGKGIEVVVLEGGGVAPDPETQSLYGGENVGLSCERPDESRSRYLGGSTNCWGGWCRPLDTIDFETRPWIADSGWPICKHDLLTYYERSHLLLELREFNYDVHHWSSEFAKKKAVLFPLEGTGLHNVISQLSPPTRFGAVYRHHLSQAPNVKLLLFANATEILTDETAMQATGVRVGTLDHKTFTVSAKVIVLATGGIENARLLLLSNKIQASGLGNGRDLVGRYYMDHPRIQSNRVSIVDAQRYRPLYDATLHRIHRGRKLNKRGLEVHLAPTPEIQRGMKLLNSRTYLVGRHGNDVSKSYFALKAIQRAHFGRKFYGYPLFRVSRDITRQLPILLAHAPRTAITVAEVLLERLVARSDFSLETVLEPVPNPESRVSLATERDQLGLNQVRIDWRLTEQDRDHFVAVNNLILAGLSKLCTATPSKLFSEHRDLWPDNIVGCWHHMGTTRMSDNPAKGVVDADCKVHGIHNLFIAGSSVFPTVGSDSPTITIVALALRLCDKILTDFP
jgi:choline dehydrogenase-like flavoprotein